MSRTKRDPLAMEHALLGLLHRHPMHGYELYQRLSDPGELWLIWRMKQSRLYALLARLESEGYLSATLQPQDARPPRKVFHLTRAGREQYLAWVRSAVPHGRELRQDFLGKFYFALDEGPAVAAALISAQRRECQGWLADMRSAHELSGESLVGLHFAPSFESLVERFRLGQVEAMLAWLDDSEQALLTSTGARLDAGPA